MISRLVTWAAIAITFGCGWQSYCFAADGDPEFGAIWISLSLLAAGVGCVANALTRADLGTDSIRRLQRQLTQKDKDLAWWKAKALEQVDEIAWSRVEVRDAHRQLELLERSA